MKNLTTFVWLYSYGWVTKGLDDKSPSFEQKVGLFTEDHLPVTGGVLKEKWRSSFSGSTPFGQDPMWRTKAASK